MTLAERGHAQAIVAVTRGGGTARRLPALRPQAPSWPRPTARTRPASSLLWGVSAVHTDIGEDVEAASQIGQQLVERGLLRRAPHAVFVSINHDLTRSDANYLKIHRV